MGLAVFCAKVAEAEKDPSAFAYVDAEIVVFRDWKPAARAHFLVCPRKHITSARALTHRDAGLARRMLDVGERVVGEARAAARADEKKNQDETERGTGTGTGTRFGYHLHMHAFALPFEPAWKERKYSVEPWARFAFEPAGETAHRLERERDARGTKTKNARL